MAATPDLTLLGLSEQKVKDTLKNAALTKLLVDVISATKTHLKATNVPEASFSKQQGTLLYHVGTRIKNQCLQHIPLIVEYIANGGWKSEQQVVAGLEYLLANTVSGIDRKALEAASGVGVVVTVDEIEDAITELINKYKAQIVSERYGFAVGKLLGEIRSSLPWADGAYVKKECDLRLLEVLGPKTEEDLAPKKKTKKEEKPKEAKPTAAKSGQPKEAKEDELATDGASTIEELMRTRANFHKPGENFTQDGYVVTPKTKDILKQHLKETGGKVVTRFPPEPNGILHIGHAKAININFGYAKAHNGICNLRFDDTNPEKEEEKFFVAIEDIVGWLGYKPARVTHSSDNFDQLYEWAIVLIKKGLAYVCHQQVEEMRGHDVKFSPWRDRPVEESLQLFEDMKNGKLDEGEATLRLKTVLEEGKVDPVAYRIKYCEHHRTKGKWCIYPTYDYTHCLCDSIENITHSLCTKEFQSRRSSYYWLCNALDIYCPVQWEYGRLNVNYTVVSKRKILKLIETKTVNDWDDPRLFTLTALRRRGIPAEAINAFVAKLGLTMSQMVIDPHFLDATVRDYLNIHAPRTMAVMEGLRVTIRNFEDLKLGSSLQIPDFPADPQCSKTHQVAVDKVVYIEESDYRSDSKDKSFYRLTRDRPVGLKHLGVVLFVEEEKKTGDRVTELVVRAEKLSESNKPKAFIHWVCKPVSVECRLYERLFRHKNPEDPAEVPGGFLSDCNTNSITVLHNVLVDNYIAKSKVYDRFQFERIGYFSVDPDATPAKLVFNRTVLLKEDAGKQ
ncbi:unnamed protein product, partial [Mesorhabditis spiculigera]